MSEPTPVHPDTGDSTSHVSSRFEFEDEVLSRAVVRLSGHILGLVFGIVMALALFVATNWLVIRGGPVVGPHLGLLSQFFIGYSVSLPGSFVGAIYAFATGYVSGLFIAWAYNSIAFRQH